MTTAWGEHTPTPDPVLGAERCGTCGLAYDDGRAEHVLEVPLNPSAALLALAEACDWVPANRHDALVAQHGTRDNGPVR